MSLEADDTIIHLNEPTFLVVDDSEVNRRIVTKLLEFNRTPYVEADNGVRAERIFRDNREFIEAIIADIKMPGLDGVELLQRVRSVEPGLPFILITGEAFTDNVVRAKTLNVSGLLVKPFKTRTLVEKLNHIFPGRFASKS